MPRFVQAWSSWGRRSIWLWYEDSAARSSLRWATDGASAAGFLESVAFAPGSFAAGFWESAAFGPASFAAEAAEALAWDSGAGLGVVAQAAASRSRPGASSRRGFTCHLPGGPRGRAGPRRWRPWAP